MYIIDIKISVPLPLELAANRLLMKGLSLMNVQGFKPVDAMGTWSIFCSLSISRFFTLVEFNQIRLRTNAYQLILQRAGINYRTYISYASRDFVIAGHHPDDVDLLICWQHNWVDCGVQVINMSDSQYMRFDDYVENLELSNQNLCMSVERLQSRLNKLN